MAIYQYACVQCDFDYEKERNINEAEPIYICEKCGYVLTRVYSPIPALFKGGGFYKTDNK